MGVFKGIFGGGSGNGENDREPLTLTWGAGQPVIVRLADGIGRFRAHGGLELTISDQTLFRENCCDPSDSKALEAYIPTLRMMAVQAMSDSLAAAGKSRNAQQILQDTSVLEQEMTDRLKAVLESKGMALTQVSVEGISQC